MNTHDASGRSGASAFVEVTALRKSFDGTMALQGVSFEIEACEAPRPIVTAAEAARALDLALAVEQSLEDQG